MTSRLKGVGILLLLVAGLLPAQRPELEDTENIKLFSMRSEMLSRFFGRPIDHLAGIVLPPGYDQGRPLPICYSVHGFGGSHRAAWRRGPELVRKMTEEGYPRMIYVFLNAQIPMGHHAFADSVNCGPWWTAFEKELAPAIEKRFGGPRAAEGRFVTGHSSGGWASLWMQVTHPDFFGGVWSTAPDPVDFRDFTGIDIYRDRNAFRTPDGEPIQLVRRQGRFVMALEKFVRMEVAQSSFGGQFFSFDAAFSPKGDDGRPMPLFDRKTGAIDPAVAEAWKKFDIRLLLERRWADLGPRLAGKINIYVGTQDTFRLEGAVRLLATALEKLGSDAKIVFAEGRDHGSLFAPHEKLWPRGMLDRIHHEMEARWRAATAPSGGH